MNTSASKVHQISLFVKILTTIHLLLHSFTLFIITSGWTLPLQQTIILLTLFCMGLVSIPAALLSSQYKPHKVSRCISWLGYSWIGFSFISFSVSLSFWSISLFFPNIWTHSFAVLWLSIILSIYALWNGLREPRIKYYKKTNFPLLKGFKIVQLSDLHLGILHLNQKWFQKIIDRVQKLNAHAIFITGDLVEGNFNQVAPIVELVKQLQAPYRVFITGNHEYFHGGSLWEDFMKNLGWTILHNSNITISYNAAKILIAGVPDRMMAHTVSSHSLPDKALQTDMNVDYKILLAHEPACVWDCKENKADIILSGHTHGGQIFPFNVLVRFFQPVVSSWKSINGTEVFAHQGTGLWGPPMRLGTQSEIAVIEFI